MSVPFFELKSAHATLQPALDDVWRNTLASGHFILGGELEAFEAKFAEYCGARFCIGVGNGLDALTLTLRALEIGSGDEVIVPTHTFIATWLAVCEVGARPVPVEPDEHTFNLDPARLEKAITPRTKAIIPVHLYGQPADMRAILEIADRHGVPVLEDAAQAHGATSHGKRAGGLGRAAGFSFYPTKNLGALGDGGAVVTSDAGLAQRLRLFRNYGSVQKYQHDSLGVNSRLDPLQAAVLSVKLRVLDEWNEKRRRIARMYSEGLSGVPHVLVPKIASGAEPVWHLYVIRSSRRDALQEALTQQGIGTLVHYPKPPHLQKAHAELGFKPGDYPIAEKLSAEVLSLPMWPHMSDDDVKRVIAAVRGAAEKLA
ncbi:DegT/DnrJ/EryC1/StrS family aminotransferase [Hyalangium sp.]|uniref:DegT/DnrJ/EryC1/StrS family aminotransferase n=1 Tax=Hyalangium sp. TaxID=2028555 RepID=UPI002D650708|nr:DegT/DnrJ/EryC1/StrS family aminotransferase [Hyalangium sp.]HYH95860.1 DegT/DnrJ/EryC1/StrS family aminotransferase [Hyalangium sp.]